MAYTTRFQLSPASIDVANCRVFSPILGALHSHVVVAEINGVGEDTNFWLMHPWLQFDKSALGFSLSKTDKVSLNVEYFYKAERPGLFSFMTGCQEAAPDKRTEIISKHYIDGHFCFDNGLYKESVINFGTVIEAILNVDLSSRTLAGMIAGEKTAVTNERLKKQLNEIRELRNKVHPKLIALTADVSKYEAMQARLALQEIVLAYKDTTPVFV